jgi:hypothetical protein
LLLVVVRLMHVVGWGRGREEMVCDAIDGDGSLACDWREVGAAR